MDILKNSYYKKELLFYLPSHLANMVAETSDDEILEAMIPELLPYIEQMKVVFENMEEAHKIIPESMYGVKKLMLYIPISINGKQFEAFIDSGAGMSIMNKKIALEAGVLHLCDPTRKVKAIGVGSQTTLGKIHKLDFIVNNSEISWSFDIMDTPGISLILGLDFLRSYRAKINMEKDCLIINDIQIPFLKEVHLHDSKKEQLELKDIFGAELIETINKSDDTENIKKAIELSMKEIEVIPQEPQEEVKEVDNELKLALDMSLATG